MLKTGPYRHPKFGGSPKKPYLCTVVRKKRQHQASLRQNKALHPLKHSTTHSRQQKMGIPKAATAFNTPTNSISFPNPYSASSAFLRREMRLRFGFSSVFGVSIFTPANSGSMRIRPQYSQGMIFLCILISNWR